MAAAMAIAQTVLRITDAGRGVGITVTAIDMGVSAMEAAVHRKYYRD